MNRKSIALDTTLIIDREGYSLGEGQWVGIERELRQAASGTRVYDSPLVREAGGLDAGSSRLSVTSESTFQAIARLWHAGHRQIGCLNFASAKNPGGGFLNGAEAQEEALSRASGLYHCLQEGLAGFYEPNRRHGSCLYLDRLIVSPGVPFFREDSGKLLPEPVLSTVITAPAPNAGAIQRNEPERIHDIVPTLRRRAGMVLEVAAVHGVQQLVLGAWGCGVFRNDPTMVAEAFLDLLKEGGAFAGVFSQVVFAVYDRSEAGANYLAFKSVLGACG